MKRPKISKRLAPASAVRFAVLSVSFVARAQTRSFELAKATIPQLQAALSNGTVASRELVTAYLARIDAYDQRGPALNAISTINPKAFAEADVLDAERRAGAVGNDGDADWSGELAAPGTDHSFRTKFHAHFPEQRSGLRR
jgi:hypothetical protein